MSHLWPYATKALSLGSTELVRVDKNFDCSGVFANLSDEKVWLHLPGETPVNVEMLQRRVQNYLELGRICWVVNEGGVPVGISCYIPVPDLPEVIEIGATSMSPETWGSGINGKVKGLLLENAWQHGAQWVLLRTDERNLRSAAAIRKLGAIEIERRYEPHVIRKDGTPRTAILFRIDNKDSS